MRIALFCATARGCLFLQKLRQLLPDSELIVFSFPEDQYEPPFLENICKWTADLGGQFYEARLPGHEKWKRVWEENPVDLMFAVSWRYMIPPSLYRQAKIGAYVFHDSLLPEYRGFSPTVWSIINGEDHTGVTIFEMSEALDVGNIVDQQSVPIGPYDEIGQVMERVTQTYLDLLERNLKCIVAGTASSRPQDHARATYTCKRFPEDNHINWNLSTSSIYNLIRAVSLPYPGAFTYTKGNKLRIWSAELLAGTSSYVGRVPGRVVEVRKGQGVVVLTGDGAVLLTQIQMEDSPIVCASDVIKTVGQTLGVRKQH